MMPTKELIEVFRLLDPNIDTFIDSCVAEEEGQLNARTGQELDFSICTDLAYFLATEGSQLGESIFIAISKLIEDALQRGPEAADVAVTHGILEPLSHLMNHQRITVLPIASHLGPRAFAYIIDYTRFMAGPDPKNWPWVSFLRNHGIDVKI